MHPFLLMMFYQCLRQNLQQTGRILPHQGAARGRNLGIHGVEQLRQPELPAELRAGFLFRAESVPRSPARPVPRGTRQLSARHPRTGARQVVPPPPRGEHLRAVHADPLKKNTPDAQCTGGVSFINQALC